MGTHRILIPQGRVTKKRYSRNIDRDVSVVTTTTTTSSLLELVLTFDDIANASLMISGDASLVGDWNTFMDLPTQGDPFASVSISGNTVSLWGGGSMVLSAYIFGDNDPNGTSLLEVVDKGNIVIICEDGVFSDYGSGLGCYALTKVHLPACIQLGNEVFASCEVLADLNLPFASYTTLGNDVFNWVPLLSDSIVNQFVNLTSAGVSCFQDCYSLVSPSFPNLSTAGLQCFYTCTSLVSPSFPSLTNAGDCCFQDCTSLTTSTLPLITAGLFCFRGCSSLTSTSLPQLITAGNYFFMDCTALTSISLPLITVAGRQFFQNCGQLTNITLPNVTSIGAYCFNSCTFLTTINLPNCTDLGGTVGDNNVFNGISSLVITLTVPEALMTCNGGSPDGDIQYLTDPAQGNTVTINGTPYTTTTTTTEAPTTTTTTTTEAPTTTTTTTFAYSIGDLALGGVIAYILQPGDPGYDAGGQSGFVATIADITSSPWGCQGTIIGAVGTEIGTGNQNTIDIMSGCVTTVIAARMCGDLDQGGYQDWYLPSKDELNKLYLNKDAIGGFTIPGWHWSSSETDITNANAQRIDSGTQSSTFYKDAQISVRAVRSFSTVPTTTTTTTEAPTTTTTTTEAPTTTTTTTVVYSIGDSALGGKIAYILQPGDTGYDAGVQHGLVATNGLISQLSIWGCAETSISTGTAIGTGNQNTINILAGCETAGIAARVCDNLDEGGYQDWYLPSRDELYKLYLNKTAIGSITNGNYWTSSQENSTYAWRLYGGNGSIYDMHKNATIAVRGVRSF